MTAVLDVLAAVLLLSGVALTLLAGIGMLRFPDVLTRMHAQTKPAVLGILLVLGGTAAAARQPGLTGTLLLVAAFQVITAPVGAHMVGRAAHRAAPGGTQHLVRDDLARREGDGGSP
ncbi:MAG: monovalent cation/H(+) antiporter subunit G [Actinomycetes bacterium]